MIDHTTTEFPDGFPPSTYVCINGRLLVAIADRVSLGWVYWTSGCLQYSGKMPTDKWRRFAEISKTITHEQEQATP